MKSNHLAGKGKTLAALLVLCLSWMLFSGCSAAQSGSTPAQAGADGRVLRVGMECAHAPNNWEEAGATETNLPIINNEGFYAEGYDVQIAKRIGEALGAQIEIVKYPWEGLLEALNQGQVDLIVSGMVDSEEHKQAAAFSDTYAVAPTEYSVMVQRGGAYASAKTLADLSGASVLGQRGTKLDTVIDQIPGVNHISPVDTIPNMLERLHSGTVDGIVINLDSAQAYLNAYPDLAVIDFPDSDGFVLDFSGICVGVRKADTALLDEINAALAGISAEERRALMPGASITERMQFNEIPPHVEYSFTQKGRDLMPVFYAMMNWGFAYDEENEAIERP
ncbi:MAG: transporter substrate-binding domain-containing protein [Subdoligranulum sp.]|nr:transporter substrate-binding domain-containing protein [Subdoligranulum sp.]